MSHLISDSKVSYKKRRVTYKPRPASYRRRESSYKHLNTLVKSRTAKTKRTDNKKRVYKKKLALLLPGHNEELIIQATIQSAIAGGQRKEDIYVVDDASTDSMRRKAVALLGSNHVLTVERSGKAAAVHKAIKHFKIEDRYQWVHVADADSIFGADYFRIYRRKLTGKDYAAAVGFVQSLKGNWISKYRVFSYTYGQHVMRRLQSWTGAVTVFPGPVTCFRTDILKLLDFETGNIAEDFEVTMQFHRQKLGKVRFIPEAVNFTQDPQTISDFCKQTTRWYRGFFQGARTYKLGMRRQMIDFYFGLQFVEIFMYLVQMLVLLPLVVYKTHRWVVIPEVMLSEYLIICAVTLFCAITAKRLSIMSVAPTFYFIRLLELSIFLKSFMEIVVMRKFKTQASGWSTEGRRYLINSDALKDAAA